MGYCEFKIPFFILGRQVKTMEMEQGSAIHDEAERVERETVEFIPLTKQMMVDRTVNLDFKRESIDTRLSYDFNFPQGRAILTLAGRTDKIMRLDDTLIVKDDKSTNRPQTHDSRTEPFIDQQLQVLTYLCSEYLLKGRWQDIPHKNERYVLNIIDRNTRQLYKTYEQEVTAEHLNLLQAYASRFTLKALTWSQLEDRRSKAKCLKCGFNSECQMAIV